MRATAETTPVIMQTSLSRSSSQAMTTKPQTLSWDNSEAMIQSLLPAFFSMNVYTLSTGSLC